MHVLRSIRHACGRGLHRFVAGLTTGLDGLTGRVGHLSDRCDAHLARRTPHLRARYRREGPQPLDLPFLHL
ncbi:hypothetical protein [Methylorubrum populi]|uniref:Uncharacterized protein n=1 Tax=Methylorubrum populi TaxID=223967 RepID=A0A921E3U3_9HYPH|nr:hypothetical protein [Methylorubrum populi]